MKELKILFLLLIGFSFSAFSQVSDTEKDTITTIFNMGIRGMWSTGNTNRISIQPNTSFSVFSSTFLFELDALYDYMTIQKRNTSNDFWSNSIFQFNHKKKWYPFITLNGGTAKSYAINHFVTTGGGIGRNVFQKTQSHFMQLHGYGAYHNASYEGSPQFESVIIGGILRSKMDLNNFLNIQWDLATYHSVELGSYWGARNFLILSFKITKQLSLNIKHQLFYNNVEFNGIEKLNTTLLFGMNYHFKKN